MKGMSTQEIQVFTERLDLQAGVNTSTFSNHQSKICCTLSGCCYPVKLVFFECLTAFVFMIESINFKLPAAVHNNIIVEYKIMICSRMVDIIKWEGSLRCLTLLSLPLLIGLFLLVRPSCTVFRHNNHVGIVSFVFGLQARQVSRRGHATGCGHFAKTLQAMSRNYLEKIHSGEKQGGEEVNKGFEMW